MKKYEVFLEVVEQKSFTKAAERMGYTQSGVTQMMNRMEEELGFPILIRSRDGIGLTTEGEYLLPAMRKVVKENENLEQQIALTRGVVEGKLKIGMFTSVSRKWMPHIIREFQKDYPGINIELFEGGASEIEQWIHERRVDMAFFTKQESYKYTWISLAKDPMIFIIPRNHRLAYSSTIDIDEVCEEPFITNQESNDQDVVKVLRRAKKEPKVKFRTEDDYTIVYMVQNELGISILPKLNSDNYHGVLVKEMKNPVYRELGIGINSMENASPAAKIFIKYAKMIVEELISK